MYMIEAMNNIFSLFADGKVDHSGYYLVDESGCDSNWLKYSDMVKLDYNSLSPYIAGILEYKDSEYFFIYDQLRTGIEFNKYNIEDLNAGLFSFIISSIHKNIKLKISQAEIKEYIFYISPKDQSYKGHSLDDIVKYFDDLLVFKLDGKSNNLHKIVIELCIENTKLLKTIDEPFTLSLVEEISEAYKIVPLKNISTSLLSFKYEQTFIELYKLIERLYPIPYIVKLQKSIGHEEVDFWILYDNVISFLNWNYQETSAIENLINELSDEQKEEIASKLKSVHPAPDVNISKCIYDIRCRLVHEKIRHQFIKYTNNEWELLYQILLLVIKYLYMKYSEIMKEAV
jgi:hypothetical protein